MDKTTERIKDKERQEKKTETLKDRMKERERQEERKRKKIYNELKKRVIDTIKENGRSSRKNDRQQERGK